MPLLRFPSTALCGALLGVGLTVGAGCTRSSEPVEAKLALGPRQTLARLRELRDARQYREMRDLVVPHAATDLTTTVLAVDEFLQANESLCDWLRGHVGVGLSQSVDQSYLADVIGPFSRHVELLDEAAIGDRATVGFNVDGRLPIQQAQMRLQGGVWRYDPGPGYSEHLPAAFREMARALSEMRADFEAGRLPVDEFRDRPERLVERVQFKLRRGTELLSKARDAAAPDANRPPGRKP